MATAPTAGRTETLNGMRIYFETHGSGEALLLLHGFCQDWLPSVPRGVQTSRSSCRTCADTAVPAFCRSRSAIKMQRPT